MKKKINVSYLIPVFLSFFVMSFVDLVGTGVDEFKADNQDIPNYILQLIPFVAFIWFFILSIPVGIWQDKVGKRKALNIGLLITTLALIVPVFGYSLPIILISFSLIGIGNTILQVSANPLLLDVIKGTKPSSFLSFSQFVKSIGSAIGPFVAAAFGPWLAKLVGDDSPGAWRYGLYLFAFITFLSFLWLSRVKIEETANTQKRASFKSCIKLLGDKFILMMVMGIFVVVGIDVAMNSNIGTFLIEKIGINEDAAKYGKSVYFIAKMIGTFVGAALLLKIKPKTFLIGSSILASLALIMMMFVQTELYAWFIIAIISLGVSNIFPLIFSIAAAKMPDRTNEISGLMMMAISGGAVIPFFVGLAMDWVLIAGIGVMLLCGIYLIIIGLVTNEK